jgi:2-polyprenyl-3-methyl-5-hydroxy-6-metoxy-1,4-benzoquinol methylase
MVAHEKVKRTRFILDSIGQFRKEFYPNISSLDVLDLGCGKGEISQQIAAQGHSVLGVDINPDRIEFSKSTRTPFCRFTVCDASDINKLELKFNVVVFSEVIEHIKQGDSVLQSVRSVLTIPGQLILTTPNAYGVPELLWERPLAPMLHFVRKIFGRAPCKGSRHINLYTYKRIRKLIAESGFNIYAWRNSLFILASSCPFLKPFEATRLAKWDCRFADTMNPVMSGGWYFDCRTRFESES